MNESGDVKAANSTEIRTIIGQCDDDLVMQILGVGGTYDEVLEAYTWLTSDDYLHRRLHRSPSGRAAQIFEILESALPEPERR